MGRVIRFGPGDGASGAVGPTSAPALPIHFTRFVGREAEVGELLHLLESSAAPLVTLVGPPGSGKTRLAVEAAHRLLEHRLGAVWFAPMDADYAEMQPSARLARALRIRLPGGDPLDALAAFFRNEPAAGPGRARLLILDGLDSYGTRGHDHADLLTGLIQRLQEFRFLVTARQELRLPFETSLRIEPISLPAPIAAAYSLERRFAEARLPVQAPARQPHRDGAERAAPRSRVKRVLPRRVDLPPED